jgi:hypothetical protein
MGGRPFAARIRDRLFGHAADRRLSEGAGEHDRPRLARACGVRKIDRFSGEDNTVGPPRPP